LSRIATLGAALAWLMLASTAACSFAQAASSEVVDAKATVVGRDAPAVWLLELDRSLAMAAGRVRTLRMALDERRLPAHPIAVGDRLGLDGRVTTPALPGDPASFEATRIEHLVEPGLRFAYFLFRSGPGQGCAECYVPLLLTAEPLGAAGATAAEVIVTFERDSIWEIRDRPGRITEVAAPPRTLRLEGQPYRYQEVALEEAIRLLRNPLGSIPISRPMLLDAPTVTRRRALLFRLGVADP
jgi:hypothetical protein